MSAEQITSPTTLPTASEASVKNGVWFVFPIDGSLIRAWGSSLTGTERIYVDDQVVSEHRSMGKFSEHRFLAKGSEFKITFTTISLLRGPLECRLFRNEVMLGGLRALYQNIGTGLKLQHLVPYLVLGVSVGLLASVFKWPLWMVIVPLCLLVFVVSLRANWAKNKADGSKGITIEEIVSDQPGLKP